MLYNIIFIVFCLMWQFYSRAQGTKGHLELKHKTMLGLRRKNIFSYFTIVTRWN